MDYTYDAIYIIKHCWESLPLWFKMICANYLLVKTHYQPFYWNLIVEPFFSSVEVNGNVNLSTWMNPWSIHTTEDQVKESIQWVLKNCECNYYPFAIPSSYKEKNNLKVFSMNEYEKYSILLDPSIYNFSFDPNNPYDG